jgi:hypothetical protein
MQMLQHVTRECMQAHYHRKALAANSGVAGKHKLKTQIYVEIISG